MIDFMLYLTYFLMALGVSSLVFFAILQIFQNAKKSKISIYIFAITMGFYVLFFFISDNLPNEKFQVSSFTSQWVGGALLLTYFLSAISLLSILFTEFYPRIKK